jgi:hypothetical protein
MIVLESCPHEEEIKSPKCTELLGLGLVSISGNRTHTIFKKGIGNGLLKTLVKIYKEQIIEKREGKIIDLLGSHTIYIHFFDVKPDIFTIFYVNEKDKLVRYDNLCSISNKLLKSFCMNRSDADLNKLCEDIIPKVSDISALFIISKAGHSLFTKINKKKKYLVDNYIQIGGFLSAITAFSQEVIGKESGENIEAINFENHQFILIIKYNLIFAYLLERNTNLKQSKRFMELVAEEFYDSYHDQINNFNGGLEPFTSFKNVVNKYFII